MLYDLNCFNSSCDECNLFICNAFILSNCGSMYIDKRYRIIPLIDIGVLKSVMIDVVHYCVKPLDYTIHTQI